MPTNLDNPTLDRTSVVELQAAPVGGVNVRERNTTAASSLVPPLLTALAFAVVFSQPFLTLVRDWWTQPEAGHGLLLGPAAVWLAWRGRLTADWKPNVRWGAAILIGAVLLRYASGLAAELFTMRVSMVLALVGLTLYYRGFQQLLKWWLPFVLLGLAIPLPELIVQAIALPLQFKASQMGAALLHLRQVPVQLSGNIIRLPGRELFVTEACSGLRSITALLSTTILGGALLLRTPVARVLLVIAALPIAIVVNGVRVFLTGFLVFFVSPAYGEGFMHATEGWLLFLVSLGTLGLLTWLCVVAERLIRRQPVYDA
jgi:exosortase